MSKSLFHFSDQAGAQTREVKEKSAKDSAKTVAIVEKASKKANPLNAANVISPVEVCEASKVQKHQTVEALSNQVVPSDGEQDVVINLPKYECLALHILNIYQ